MARVIAISLLATDRMSRTFDRASGSVRRFEKSLESIEKVGKFTSLAIGAASAVALTKALVPLAAATTALPSALLSVKAATVTLKVGLYGVGDAMKQVASGDAKKLDEALKKLSPNARAFVKETASLNKEWTKVRRQVQDSMFVGLDKQLRGVAKNLLPTVSLGMKSVATDINRMGVEAAKVMQTQWFKGRVATVFKNAGDATHILTGAIRPLLDVVTRLAEIGAPLVNQFLRWAVAGLKTAQVWLKNADNMDRMKVMANDSIGVFGQLGRIGKNLVTTLVNLTGASDSFLGSNGDMLTVLEQLTTKMANWSKSSEGQRQASETFKLLGDTMRAMLPILTTLGGIIAMVAKVLTNLPGPVRQVVVQTLAWSVVVGLLGSKLKMLSMAGGGLKILAGGFKGVWASMKFMVAAPGQIRMFIGGFRNVNSAMYSGASRATTFGASVRLLGMKIKELALSGVGAVRNALLLSKAWAAARIEALKTAAATAKQKAAAAGNWLMSQVAALKSLVVAQAQAARAAIASAVASARQKVAVIATAVAQKAAAVGARLWAAAQWVLNAALSANPIGLVVIAIVALVAGIVLAYNKFSWFRAAVNAIWNWLKSAVVTTINFIRDHWQLIVAILLGPLGIAFAVVTRYWTQIKNFIMGAVNAVINFIRDHWKLIVTIIGGPLGAVVVLIISNWNRIKSAISAAMNFITGFLRTSWNTAKAVVSSVMNAIWSVVNNAWNRVKSTTSNVMNGVRSVISSVLGHIKSAFSGAVSSIATIWSRLQEAARKPVNFVIGIYNNGIRPLVRNLSKMVGHEVDPGGVKTFAKGGIMPGYAPGKDSLLAAVSPGESIFRPEFTRAVGPGWVTQANALARRGGPSAVRDWLVGGGKLGGEGIGFANGGVVRGFAGHFDIGGVVGGLMKGLKNFSILDPLKAFRSALDKITGGKVPGAGMIRDQVAGLPKWINDKVWGWIKSKISSFGIIGGKGYANALNWAKSQSGKPYVWGGVGPGGYDCSGFMSAITNVIHGKSPYSRLFSTHSFTGGRSGPSGFLRNAISPFQVGVTNAGVGHMAGTLNGVNVESNGSQGVHYGSGARGAKDGLFSMRYGLHADTGSLTLARGWNPVFNGTGGTEYLATPEMAGGGSTYNINVVVDPASGAHPADVGEAIVKRIKDYERARGKSWRS